MKIHIVQKGDTLWKIAKKYGVNFEELKKLNSQLSNPDMIMPGMKIKVPTSGGNIKKETQTGTGGAKINLGSKKEQPIKEQPIVKEKPIKEMPVQTPKEKPVKEVPVKEVPIKEVPVETPVKEKPVEKPKEKPKKPFIPKIPQPIIPDIDINNYYMTNMSNINVHEPAKVPPPLPKKPENILPTIPPIPKELPKKELPIKELPKKEAPVKSLPKQKLPKKVAPTKPLSKPKQPIQKTPTGVGGQYQPMIPYPQQMSPIYNPCAPVFNPCQDPCYPGSQAMPMPYPNMLAQGPYPPVQGAYMPMAQPLPYPEVQGSYMPAQPLPYPEIPSANMPVQPQGFPEVQGSYMPAQPIGIPEMPNANIPVQSQGFPEVQGSYMPAQPIGFPEMPNANIPVQSQGFPEVQGSYMSPESSGFSPMAPMGGYNLPTNLMPGVPNNEMLEESSPFMGFEPTVAGAGTMPEPFYGAPVNPSYQQHDQFVSPQVQGQNMAVPQPMMPAPVMPTQMPMMDGTPMGYPPYPAQNKNDCGCGGPKASPYGSMQPGYRQQPYPQGESFGHIPPYSVPYGYAPVPPYPEQFDYGQQSQFHPIRYQETPDYGNPYAAYEGFHEDEDQRDEIDESY